MAKIEFLVILDHDRHEFSVHGPMEKDTGLTRRVEACGRGGRRVRCFGVDEYSTKEEVVAAYRGQSLYECVEDCLSLPDQKRREA